MLKLLALVLLLLLTLPLVGQAPEDPARLPVTSIDPVPGHELVWHDEFDGDGAPDPARWNFENGFVRNNEAQWYQPQNATVRGGLLVIEGRRERVPNPRYEAGSGDWRRQREFAEWTSSSLNTWGKFAWPLDRVQIVVRARLSPQPGYFPAIWTTGPGQWPHGGEVDLMECYGGRILANFAWGTTQQWNAHWHAWQNPQHGDQNRPRLSWFLNRDPDWLRKFHVWRLVGSDSKTQILCDDELLNEVTHEVARNPQTPWSQVVHPFREPHALILNLAIGGPGGDPGPATSPLVYEVDYARVYQRPAAAP
ncbi:MAG: glycoside hydrolase family 16 protein [Fimbriimonadaceae bacterium]|nr:glycoside hydrolase family 16 protein [Fimbriimonadaceae bacterium]